MLVPHRALLATSTYTIRHSSTGRPMECQTDNIMKTYICIKEIPLTAPTNRDTVLESDHGEAEVVCYSCCSVGPDPTVGGQHHHLYPTRQGTCTGEGGL